MPHSRFRYGTAQQLRDEAARLGLDLPYDEDLSALARPVRVGPALAPNALAVQPMEGCH